MSFKYKANDTYAVDKVNVELISDGGKIIGITGISGRGKSTLIRLLLKLHSPETGEIFIDDMPISDLDPDYIRHNITYVNQNGKLFDRKVIENILYGCNHPNDCNSNLKRIYKYPKIKDMLQSIDLEKDCGALGENLSGGQRQIVNIISVVINNSKILILDEPTNALDPQLKKDVVQMIDDFAKEKNAIIIITHDKELLPLFNQVIYIS